MSVKSRIAAAVGIVALSELHTVSGDVRWCVWRAVGHGVLAHANLSAFVQNLNSVVYTVIERCTYNEY